MNIYDEVKGLPQTEKEYWKDSYLVKSRAKVIKIFREGSNYYIVTDKTIFYPQGGDQVPDVGLLKGSSGVMEIKKVLLAKGVVLYFGKINGEIKEDDDVELEVDETLRRINMRMHSLGHLIGSSMWEIRPEIKVVGSLMARPGWIKFEGELNEGDIKKINELAQKSIEEDKKTIVKFVTLDELKRICKHVPEKLPPTNLRIVQIEGFEPIPCGGTHVKSLSEIGEFKIVDIEPSGEHKIILFDLA